MTSSLAFRSLERIDGTRLAAAREFYVDVLGGREIRRSRRAGDERMLFIVGRTVIETGPAVIDARHPNVICVDNVEGVACRCWDAGFTVILSVDASPPTSIVLIDPFGRSIEVVQRA